MKIERQQLFPILIMTLVLLGTYVAFAVSQPSKNPKTAIPILSLVFRISPLDLLAVRISATLSLTRLAGN